MQDSITSILKAIADSRRREIFHFLILATTSLSITQISNQFEISRQGVTKHLRALEEVGLVKIESKGRERYCTANANPLKQVIQWVSFYEKFWNNTLENLDSYLDSNA